MSMITTNDGVQIFYKDWGSGQPIVFSHGWPLSSDDWDAQLMFFLNHGYRVIAHDRRGHGRSSQTADGHDMDHYADDLAALTAELDLKEAVHVGHSTGGGEVVRYIARHGADRVAKARLNQRGAAAHGENGGESRRSSESSFRRLSSQAGSKSIAILFGYRKWSVLRFQSAGSECLRRCNPQLVATRHDGRNQGTLRWDCRLLAD